MTDPQKDEHIEELLSKLQGIFGKLSHGEEEESRSTPEVAPVPPPPAPKVETPAPAPKPEVPAPVEPPPMPILFQPAVPPAPEPVPAPVPEPVTETPAPAQPEPEFYPPPPPPPPEEVAPAEPPQPAPAIVPTVGNYESAVPTTDPEKTIVPTAIYFQAGRENEARIVAQKLETMTPKFTKVVFRLRVVVFAGYDPKGDWKETILATRKTTPFQTVFVLMDRPLDDAKRKSVSGDLEGQGVYFQDVMLAAIEKKAFYTDVLLGLVFFFDSHKPAPAPNS